MKTHLKEEKKNNGARSWMRSVCMLCAIAFALVACVGCIAQESVEEKESLKNGLSDAVEELDSVKEVYGAAQQEIESLKSSNETAQQEITLLKERDEAAKQELESLKERDDAVQKELDLMKESYEAAQEEIDSLKSDSEAAQEEMESLKSTNEALQQELEAVKAQLQEMLDKNTEEPGDKIKIYIDQGHNPTAFHNSGAVGNGLYEEDLTFEIGCLLAELLLADGRFEVRLSRPNAATVLGTDNTTSLAARVADAQDFDADYFISLHVNSFTQESAHGLEVHVMEENTVSHAFGNSLLQGLLKSTGLRDRGMKISPSLYVLKNATMPAALVEMGFISNVGDSTLLAEQPDLFAKGIYNGILEWFHLSAPSNSAE